MLLIYKREIDGFGSVREMGPRNRNGISRRLGDIVVLVQSILAFLTMTDLYFQSKTVSDYHPLFWIFGYIFAFQKV